MSEQHDTHVVVWRLWRQWGVLLKIAPPKQQAECGALITAFVHRRCPDCSGFIFRPGPRGGLSQNIECVGCGNRFNVTRWNGPKGPVIIFAERVENREPWREDLFPQVLQ